jgi:hypothetical protein
MLGKRNRWERSSTRESIPCFVRGRTTLVKASKACVPQLFFEHCDTWRAITANRSARLHSARGSLPPLVSRTVHAPFEAHGSSGDRTLVMSTSPLGEFVKSTVSLVVTR